MKDTKDMRIYIEIYGRYNPFTGLQLKLCAVGNEHDRNISSRYKIDDYLVFAYEEYKNCNIYPYAYVDWKTRRAYWDSNKIDCFGKVKLCSTVPSFWKEKTVEEGRLEILELFAKLKRLKQEQYDRLKKNKNT